jgi:NADH-quinone oxidoreductase subunit K
MSLVYPTVLAGLLFAVGVYGVLARRNAVLILMSVELMLGAVVLNLVAFDAVLADPVRSGQVLALFVIVIAAAEVGVGLAVVLLLFRHRGTVSVDVLGGRGEVPEGADRRRARGPVPAGPGGGVR